jgi:translation initiation factor IF-1
VSDEANASGTSVPPAGNPEGETGAAAAPAPEAGKGTVQGVVVEALPNTLFRVELGDGEQVLSYLAGKMRLHRIRVLVGDRVEIIKDPYGGRARVVRRL